MIIKASLYIRVNLFLIKLILSKDRSPVTIVYKW